MAGWRGATSLPLIPLLVVQRQPWIHTWPSHLVSPLHQRNREIQWRILPLCYLHFLAWLLVNSALASEYRASCERLVPLLDANTLLIWHDGREAAESEINVCYSHLSLVHRSIAQAWSELLSHCNKLLWSCPGI